MIISIILGIVLALFLIWITIDFFNIIFRGFAPLIFSKKSVIDLILKDINSNSKKIIYELGCGSARFLQVYEKKFLDVKLVGIEHSIITFLIFSIFFWIKKSKIKIYLKNIFKTNLQEADVIYCYLFPSMMSELGKKIRSECKSGTIFISYMFSVPNWDAKQIIKDGNDTIYFYEV